MSADFVHLPAGRSGPARSRNPIASVILGVAVALPASLWLWGFTVDDALITARVAAHCAQGIGPRFNPHGPITDAVTPLGYAPLLSLLGSADVLRTFEVSKWFGLGCWLVAAGLLGSLIGRSGERWRRYTPLALVSVSAPLAAWAVSGMETGLVTLLATLGLLGGAPGALALGVAAGLRPELIPFAVSLLVGRVLVARPARARVAVEFALVLLPALIVALVRLICFGRAVPLSFYAKPSDFAHGLRYALGAFAFTGFPWLLLATPREFLSLPRAARPLFGALAAHAAALVLCGGDWMALYRLAVPVLPCAALAAAHLAERARFRLAVLRFGVGLLGALLLLYGLGRQARSVGTDRAKLIAAARPVLSRDVRIVALDIGWVGAASSADVIDLAGVTDPEVALFPGGHTSKRVPGPWLFACRPTAVVLLLARGAPSESSFADAPFSRAVEQRVARLLAGEFRVRTQLRLADQTYVVLEPGVSR
jgi:hypothetical protein